VSKRLTTLVLALTLLTTLLGAPGPAAAYSPRPDQRPAAAPAAERPRAAPAAIQPQAAIPCDSSPFGRVLTIGAEREIYAGYLGGFGAPQAGRLLYDRVDLSGLAALARSFASTAADPALQGVAAPAAGVAADVNGDGTVEFVQVFNDSAGLLRTMTSMRDGSTLLRQFGRVNHSELQAAALSRGTNTRDRVVVASRTSTGALSVIVIDPVGETVENIFTSNTEGRQDLSELRLAVGDMDNDGSRDEIAVAFREGSGGSVQLLVLTTATVPASGSGANMILNMRLVDFERLNIGGPQRLALALGDLNGDYRDELIYAQEQATTDTPGISSGIATRAFTFDPTNTLLAAYLTRDESLRTSQLALAAGDTDRDGRDELVRAYRDFGDNSAFVVESFDAEQGQAVARRNRYVEAGGPRASFDELALDVGDMDRDGFDDIVAGVRDADRQLNLVRLEDSELPLAGISLGGQMRDGADGRTNHSGLLLRLGDFDDDSIKAHYQAATGSALICERVVEPQINAAVFAPPYWQAIQGEQEQLGVIGESSSESRSEENSITTSQSHSVSGYIGFEIDAETVEFSAKVTGGYERAASATRSGGTIESETLTTARSNVEGDFVLVENAVYNCYSYQVRQTGAALDGQMRFCDYQLRTEESPSLDSWDIVNGPASAVKARQWAPVARDWANLALFPSTPAVQSSTAGDATAARANDGLLEALPSDAAVTRTNSEPAPWWQIDLDTVQPISKVRVWNRSNTDCGSAGCPAPLADFNVFVSSVDPRTISNDPNALKADPRVQSFFFSGNAAEIATVLTLGADLEPVRGRFVRVQLAGAGVLSLAEVQVFGTNHVDPHRYPVAISDPTPGDGYFTVKLFDPRTEQLVDLQTRGNLVWNGTASGLDVLKTARVGSGGGQTTWSIAKDVGTSSATATSVENLYRVGVEFDFAGGAFVKATGGVGYEFESGVGEETVRSLEVTNGFEVGGTVTGFPTRVNNKVVTWPTQCAYGLQPYYYEVTEVSSAGYAHRYLVLDYVVPAIALDRTANLAACQVERTGAPTFESNFTTGGPGSLFVLTAQGFQAGSTAQIDLRGPGQSQFQPIVSLTMDGDGALVFVLATQEDAQPGDYQVRITSGPSANGAALAQAQVVRELTLRVERAAEVRDERPAGTPVIEAPDTGRLIFLPLLRR
jgi:hypothetical protein